MGGHNHTAVAQGLDWRLPGISICPPPRFESGEGVMEMTGGEALSLTRPVPLSCLSGDLWGDRHSTWWGKLLAIPTSQPGQAWPSNYWGHCWLPWLSVALSGSEWLTVVNIKLSVVEISPGPPLDIRWKYYASKLDLEPGICRSIRTERAGVGGHDED